ncbi:unnamed protein product, partial [Closterium sp. NIES-53]
MFVASGLKLMTEVIGNVAPGRRGSTPSANDADPAQRREADKQGQKRASGGDDAGSVKWSKGADRSCGVDAVGPGGSRIRGQSVVDQLKKNRAKVIRSHSKGDGIRSADGGHADEVAAQDAGPTASPLVVEKPHGLVSGGKGLSDKEIPTAQTAIDGGARTVKGPSVGVAGTTSIPRKPPAASSAPVSPSAANNDGPALVATPAPAGPSAAKGDAKDAATIRDGPSATKVPAAANALKEMLHRMEAHRKDVQQPPFVDAAPAKTARHSVTPQVAATMSSAPPTAPLVAALLCDAIICIHICLPPIKCSCVAYEDLVELDDSGPKAWKLLRDVIQPNMLPMVIVLEKELAALSIRPGDDVKPVLDKIKDTYGRMAAAGSNVSQMQQCTKIISVLDNSWDKLIPTLNTQQDQWTPEWLWHQILQEDFRRRHTGGVAANKTAEGCIKDLWQLPIIPWNGKPPATAAAVATAKATAGGEETAPTDGALDAVKKVQQKQQPHGEVLASVDATAAWAKASSGSGEADWETWHERLCHVNFPMLQKLVKDVSLKGLEVKGAAKEIGSCPTCLETKFTKFPFSSSTGPAKAPLALVHMDVVGPTRAPYLSGSRYFLTIVDDHTRVVWVYPLKTKGEVAAAVLKEWMPRAQRESGHKVKVIRTDNGGEFIGADFEAVLKKKGIQHQLTVPYNPQQNGVAECFNRTLQEGARTLLGRAGLSDPFWVTALRQVALVKNRMLATVGDKQWVPYTKWYGSAPAVNMLRAYGCMVVFHVPKEKRGKLEASGRWGVHLGLAKDHKGWLIWDLTSQQLIVSRDMKFLKSLYYKEWKQQQQKLPTSPLIIEDDEDGGEPVVEEKQQQQQQQDAPPRTQRPPDRPRRDVRPPKRLTYPSFGKPKVVRAGSVAEQCDEDEIAHCYWAAVPEPKTLAEALSEPDAEKWKQSVKEEYDSLLENGSQEELCELPPRKKAISSKLIFRHKYGPDGELTRYKSRLVANGFQQAKGKDFDKIFAPVGKATTLRDDGSGRVCRLKKAIYGLKQAPRAWYHKLEETLLAGGFKKSECDHSLFLLQDKEQFLMLLVYVDDILLFSESSAMIERVEEILEMQFKCSKMGDVKYYLGIHVERDLNKGVLRLHQRKYCEGLAEKYGLQDGGKPATPLPSGFTVEPYADEDVVGESDRKLFHSMVGALNYAVNHTRPDIAFATSRLASVVSRPSHEHAVRQRQQRGAADLSKGEMLLTCYIDASFNSVKADGTSIGGYVCLFGGGAVSWRSKMQNEVGLSSCETEYMALHHG